MWIFDQSVDWCESKSYDPHTFVDRHRHGNNTAGHGPPTKLSCAAAALPSALTARTLSQWRYQGCQLIVSPYIFPFKKTTFLAIALLQNYNLFLPAILSSLTPSDIVCPVFFLNSPTKKLISFGCQMGRSAPTPLCWVGMVQKQTRRHLMWPLKLLL